MKLYTKTGDRGDTGLFGGERVRKDHERVRAYGAIDEANSAIGMAASASPPLPDDMLVEMKRIMSDLFDIGAELATPDATKVVTPVEGKRIEALEKLIDAVEAEVPPLKTFVLPAGTDGAARLHYARTVVRRAEREIVSLSASLSAGPNAGPNGALRDDVIIYVNRLSDLLFAWARLANHRAGVGDVPWTARK